MLAMALLYCALFRFTDGNTKIFSGTAGTQDTSSRLCFLPSCFPHLYYYITTGLTWKAAQDYCRSKYTDLATIHTEQEQTKLNQLLQSQLYVWIGLHADTDAWSWSLENQDYYGLGEAGFRMWAPFEPNDDGNYQVCVLMTTAGEWADGLCTWELPFICYSGKKGHTVAI
uniref:C-type lectin domain-containing protein n=1 Tax=Anabas testudineus TaxID=64144 RepID=A0A7N6BJL5_ANATE